MFKSNTDTLVLTGKSSMKYTFQMCEYDTMEAIDTACANFTLAGLYVFAYRYTKPGDSCNWYNLQYIGETEDYSKRDYSNHHKKKEKQIMVEIQKKTKANKFASNFGKRVEDSTKLFEDFYTENLTVASVHFRLLYRIFQLIEKSKIDIHRKREVAKIVRCQLSEQELFLIRYNAMSRHGKNMQKYINQYNLLKHLPLLSKLEFSSYATTIVDEIKINIINTEFYLLKQETAKLLLNPKGGDYSESLSERYTVKLHVNEARTSYKISILRKDKNKSSEPVDEAFDKLTTSSMLELLKDFTMEVFQYSNFQVFNDYRKLNIDPHTDKQNQTSITTVYVDVTNKDGYKLKCTQRHLDNPQS